MLFKANLLLQFVEGNAVDLQAIFFSHFVLLHFLLVQVFQKLNSIIFTVNRIPLHN